MSKRTRRERRLERAAQKTAKERGEQAELLPEEPAEEEAVVEQPIVKADATAPVADSMSTGFAEDRASTADRRAEAEPEAEVAPSHAERHSAIPPFPEPPPVFVTRPPAVPFEPLAFDFDDDEERPTPVEFELVMLEERPKKAPRIDKTSRVRVDEEPETDLEASAEQLGRARELVRDGRIEEAMELYRVIVSDHPQSLKARNNLGVLYDELGQHERALEQFEMARGLSPDNVEVLSNLGSALLGLSRFEDAERELRRAQKIDPESVEVRANLGILYHRRGLYAQADTELRWVCERDHDHGPAHFYRGEALNRLGRVDQALDVLERAMRLQPSNSKIYHMMGILFDKKHMPVEAAQMYKKMRELRS